MAMPKHNPPSPTKWVTEAPGDEISIPWRSSTRGEPSKYVRPCSSRVFSIRPPVILITSAKARCVGSSPSTCFFSPTIFVANTAAQVLSQPKMIVSFFSSE